MDGAAHSVDRVDRGEGVVRVWGMAEAGGAVEEEADREVKMDKEGKAAGSRVAILNTFTGDHTVPRAAGTPKAGMEVTLTMDSEVDPVVGAGAQAVVGPVAVSEEGEVVQGYSEGDPEVVQDFSDPVEED